MPPWSSRGRRDRGSEPRPLVPRDAAPGWPWASTVAAGGLVLLAAVPGSGPCPRDVWWFYPSMGAVALAVGIDVMRLGKRTRWAPLVGAGLFVVLVIGWWLAFVFHFRGQGCFD